MNRKPYSEYKESGVEWLGQVPGHWEIRPVKAIVSTPVTDGPHETPEILDEGIPFVSAEAISNGKINFNKIRGYISEEDHRRYSRKYKPEFGDIYMVKSGATTGRVAMVETHTEFNIWSPLAAIRCNPSRADKRFIFFYLQSKEFQTGVELSWSFGTQQNIGMGVIQNLAVPLSTLPEQTAIADFLDRETGRIDTLVAKKRRLVALLGEKRTSLISRTVTRGLPADAAREFGLEPHTRFKDSGIEWLGEVPVGWTIEPVKNLATPGKKTFTDGDWVELPFITDYGIRLLQTGNVGIGKFKEQGFRYISNESFNELRCTEVQPNDVLICRLDGPVGRACLAPDLGVKAITSVDNTILKCCDTVSAQFVVYLLSTSQWLSWIDALCRVGGGFRVRISRIMLGNIRVPKPPLPEQTAIATYLDRETAKIDQLVTKVEAAIVRLLEYRTALITAAVTGKIDVRGEGGQTGTNTDGSD